MEAELPFALHKQLSDIQQKLEVVTATQKQLKWRIEQLENENQKLRQEKKEVEDELHVLKKKYSSLQKDFSKSRNFAKIVTHKLTPSDGLTELKEAVELYIQEINKCIEVLEDTL